MSYPITGFQPSEQMKDCVMSKAKSSEGTFKTKSF